MKIKDILSNYRNTYRGVLALIIGTLLIVSAFYVPILSGFLLTDADGTINWDTIIKGSIGLLFLYGGIKNVHTSLKAYAKKKLEN